MKIVETRPGGAAQRTARPKRSQPGGFASALGSGAEASASSAPRPIGAAAGVLIAQEVAAEPDERKRARERGEDLLDRLDALRLDLLEGRVPEHRLAGLLAAVQTRRGAFLDPRLGAILDEIELRAAVELAKLGRYP